MSRETDPEAVEVERTVQLPVAAEQLWQALTDEELLGEWLGSEVHLDVRPGGIGRVIDDDGTVRDVLVAAVDPGRSVTWHWWSERDGVSTVHVDVEEVEGGASRLRVVESLGADPSGAPPAIRACARRWERATTRLWERVGLAVAR